jgi:hypothetical protein
MNRTRIQTQCENCPFADSDKALTFRRTVGPTRWASILKKLQEGGHFACHKTTKHDENGHVIESAQLLCAGSIEWQEKNGASATEEKLYELA